MTLVAKRDDPSVLLRVPGALLERINAAAERNGRSRNSEILILLARGLVQSDGQTPDELETVSGA